MKTLIRILRNIRATLVAARTSFGMCALVASITGCGVLGEREAANRTLSQENTACLDGMGPLIENYIDGNVSEAKWRETWNCVDDTIDLFKSFVQGSEAEKYSPADLLILTRKFLFSKNTVTPAFIEGVLSVKASILGGSSKDLTKVELENYRGLVRFLRDETSALIPHLHNRRVNPTPANLRAMADALEQFGERFANRLNTSGNPTLTTDQAALFVRELAALGLKISPDRMEAWTRLMQELKVVLVRGAADGISGDDWSKLFKMGFKIGGSTIALLTTNSDEPLFQTEMIDRMHAVLKTSVAAWGGKIPFSELEKVIDLLPSEMIPELASDFRIGAKALLRPRKKTVENTTTNYRPALARIFLSRSDDGIDAAAIQRLVDDYQRGMRANSHLKNILGGSKEDLTAAQFATRAQTYISSLRDSRAITETRRLITVANRYLGLHPSDTPEILFNGQSKHSLNNLKRMSWYEIISEHLLEAYGSTTNELGRAAHLDDLTQLIEDINPVLYSFGMMHPNKVNIDKKRFREANLFMPNGNGDDKMDLAETSVYIAYVMSAGEQAFRIMNLAVEGDHPCPMVGWNIPLKIKSYDVKCFRQRWKENFAEIFTNMPRLQDDYDKMNAQEKEEFHHVVEHAAKASGYDDAPISAFDISSYAGLPHFAEAVMQKFDRDGDQTLNREETLENVFPVFKRELAEFSGIKIDFLNKAFLLYLMQRGEKPNIGSLALWALTGDHNKSFNARRLRVFQIFATLSPPVAADPISQTPPAGVQNSLLSLTSGRFLSVTPSPRSINPSARSKFDISTVDPVQLQGYSKDGPMIDPNSPHQEALEVLPQDL